jgi:hypothetical protein
MAYFSVSARFKFWDGHKGYTVEYSYGVARWYLFNNEETDNAIYHKEDKKIKFKNINSDSAGNFLIEYLGRIKNIEQEVIF